MEKLGLRYEGELERIQDEYIVSENGLEEI